MLLMTILPCPCFCFLYLPGFKVCCKLCTFVCVCSLFFPKLTSIFEGQPSKTRPRTSLQTPSLAIWDTRPGDLEPEPTPPRFSEMCVIVFRTRPTKEGSNSNKYGCWSKNRVNFTPWMVKIMENPIKHGMIWGFPIIFGNTHILTEMQNLRYFCMFIFLGSVMLLVASYKVLIVKQQGGNT